MLVAGCAEEAGGAVAVRAVVDAMYLLAPLCTVGGLAFVGLARRLKQWV